MPLPLRPMRIMPLVLIGMLLGCEPILDCQLDANSNAFYMEFNHSSGLQVSFDSVKNSLIETVFFDADSSYTTIQLPITEASPGLRYTFFTDSTDYFLEVTYESRLNLYGDDCPPSNYFFNLEITNHNFDSVVVTNPELDRRLFENIQAFF